MMTDYISRQAAIEALGEEPEVWSGKDEYEQGLNNQWHYDVNALKALPSAQKHGKWEYIGGYGYQYRCSECIMCVRYTSKYCPHCGAKMDGENDGI